MKLRFCIHALALLAIGVPMMALPAEVHKLKVVTSFLPVYCFTASVAGDLAEVENLTPPGTEPHDFQFSPREMKRLEAADLVVVNGLQIEAWLGRVMSSQDHPKAIVELATGLDSELIRGAANTSNPHIWLDPQLAKHGVTNILLALQKADPAHAVGYARNAREYLARLEKLDADLRAGLVPFHGQSIITFHDAFPYFARRYGLKVAGVIEKVPDVQPSPKYLSALKRVIERDQVKVIFTERQSSPKLAGQIGRDYHVAVAELDTLETGELKPEAYEAGMRANLGTLEKYLK